MDEEDIRRLVRQVVHEEMGEFEQIAKKIARESSAYTAKEAVSTTLMSLGVDVNNPIDTQTDMQSLREWTKLYRNEEFRKDLAYAHELRVGAKAYKRTLIGTLITLAAAFVVGLLWAGWKTKT